MGYDSPTYQNNRRMILADGARCHWCDKPATQADHLIETDRGGSDELDNLVPACAKCNAQRGRAYSAAKQRFFRANAMTPGPFPVTLSHGSRRIEPSSEPMATGVAGSAPIDPDRPRLESALPPGSSTLGPDVCDWAAEHLGVVMMPWQEHVLEGMLATGDDGALIHEQSLVTVARQNGKTECMVALIGWWLTERAAELGPQNVMSCAHDLQLAERAFTRLAPVLVGLGGKVTAASFGRKEITVGASSWTVRSAKNDGVGHGLALDLVVIDEIWNVKSSVIDDAIMPTFRTRPQPLLAMFSTAGTADSHCLRQKRDVGLRSIVEPMGFYFAEWSPPPADDPMTPEAWAWANPALGHRIKLERLAADAERTERSAFIRSTCNTFVASLASWLPVGLWQAGTVDPDPAAAGGIIAVDRSVDQSTVSAITVRKTGQDFTVAHLFTVPTVAAAMRLTVDALAADPTLRLILGASLELHKPAEYTTRTVLAGQREVAKYTAPVRGMILDGFVRHVAHPLLDEQIVRAATAITPTGMVLAASRSSGPIELCRMMVWSVGALMAPALGRPAFASA